MSILNLLQSINLLYIDPAATSVLLSSITAVAVAIGASAIIIWRKLKKKIDTTLNRDPNAGKEIEEELVITDTEIAKEVTEETTEVEKTEEEKAEEKEEVVEEKKQKSSKKSTK